MASVVPAVYAPFLVQRPFEQLKLDLAHQDVGAVLVSIGASYDAVEEGRTHQAPEDVALLDTLPGWIIHVPGHPDEAEAVLRRAVVSDDRSYLRLSEATNAVARPVGSGRFHVVRWGSRGTVVAVGPMLDRTVEAVAGLDVTVLYATTVRPFDAATLVETLGEPNVVLVESNLDGTSAAAAAGALRHAPHRLLALGVPRIESRRYGTASDHDCAHGLDAPGLRRSITGILPPARP